MPHSTRLARPGKSDNSGLIGLGILVVIGLLIGGFFLIRYIYRSQVLAPFETSRNEFAALRPNADVNPTEGMCKGNVIALDKGTSQFDHFFFDLPDDLKPADPASVKTVVFLHWSKIKVDEYTGGKPAYQHHCDMDIVDRESKALLRRAHFIGSEPPQTISGRSSSGEGNLPTEQMIAFLRASGKN
jgi:hypothetical protein